MNICIINIHNKPVRNNSFLAAIKISQERINEIKL